MIKQSVPTFDSSTIPNDLCPIATKFVFLRTGDWRAMRPVLMRERCVKCATCWLYCPTQCIVEKATWFEANLDICKGCGICAEECPQNAIKMEEETEK